MNILSIKNIAKPLVVLAFAAAISYSQTYSGQAVAAKATVAVAGQPIVTSALSDTGELSYTGGNVNLVGAGTTLAGIATVGTATVSTTGLSNASSSASSVASTSINVLGNAISAGVIQAATQSLCPGSVISGSSAVANLQINGVGVTVLGTPNQSVTLFTSTGNGPVAVGQLILNEEILGIRGITRNALRLTATALDGLTTYEVIVSSTRSRIDCGQLAGTNIFSGRGRAVYVNERAVVGPVFQTSSIADTGRLPWFGGDTSATTANANVAGIVATGTVSSTTEGGTAAGTPNATASSSDVENLSVNASGPLTGILLNASALESDTNCTCGAQVPSCSGSSSTAGLTATALGLPVSLPVNPPVNTTINIAGVGVLHLNEEIVTGSGNLAAITRNALRLELNLLVSGTDLTVASSRSSIVCGLTPTAAEVTLSGRVTDNYGRGISRALVSATDESGMLRTATTNSFGNYVLRGLPAGAAYIVSVAGTKRFSYTPRFVSLEDNLSGFDFAPDGYGNAKGVR